MAKPVRATEKAQFVDLFTAGRTIAQIAQDLERSPLTVQEHLAAAGTIDRKPPRGVTAEQITALGTGARWPAWRAACAPGDERGHRPATTTPPRSAPATRRRCSTTK
ncbi:hypothetical protein [Actinomadura sp. 9N215]|uniref:hypothetical protein n=1 Tax=Actinomadura sp. 9N215 TaxID=3375150 RepID=UPI0037B9BD90